MRSALFGRIMKLSPQWCLITLLGIGCGGAIAPDLGSSDSGSTGDSANGRLTDGADGGYTDYVDAGSTLHDAGRIKDAAHADANPSFACGVLLICDRNTQVCKVGMGGPTGAPPSYACDPIPPACLTELTCDCMKREVFSNACSITNGAITIEFFYP